MTHISGEPRTAIIHRNLDNWTELKELSQNSYIEKWTLYYHASQLFKSRQNKDKQVTDWIQTVQTLGSQFRETALLNCSDGAREGILDLSDRLRNICFVHGLASDRIQTIVRSRNFQNLDEIAETALVDSHSGRIANCVGTEKTSMHNVSHRLAVASKRYRTFGCMFFKPMDLENVRVNSLKSLLANTPELGMIPYPH